MWKQPRFTYISALFLNCAGFCVYIGQHPNKLANKVPVLMWWPCFFLMCLLLFETLNLLRYYQIVV